MHSAKKKIKLGTFNEAPITLGDVLNSVTVSPVRQYKEPTQNDGTKHNSRSKETNKFPAGTHFHVSIERKGRAGKTVTLLKGFTGNDEQFSKFVKELKSSLGCGASYTEELIILQGDQRDRLKLLLMKYGATKISVG